MASLSTFVLVQSQQDTPWGVGLQMLHTVEIMPSMFVMLFVWKQQSYKVTQIQIPLIISGPPLRDPDGATHDAVLEPHAEFMECHGLLVASSPQKSL